MATQCDTSSNSSDYIEYDTDTEPMWISITIISVGVITILVNIPAVIAVILTKFRYPNVRNTYLLILGITDILAGVSLFPILISCVDPYSKSSYWSCFLRMFFFTLIYYSSIGQVCVICIDRVFLLSKPSWRYTSRYERRYFGMLFIMFLFTFLSVCLIFFIHGEPQTKEIKCNIEILFCNNLHRFSAVSGGVAAFIQSLIIACSIGMIVILHRHRRKCRQIAPANRTEAHTDDSANNHGHSSRENQFRKMTAEAKSTLTIIIIIINLIICVTPLNFSFLLQGLHLVGTTSRTTRNVFICLSCTNSAINPFVYCFRTPEVKAIFNSGFSKCIALFQL